MSCDDGAMMAKIDDVDGDDGGGVCDGDGNDDDGPFGSASGEGVDPFAQQPGSGVDEAFGGMGAGASRTTDPFGPATGAHVATLDAAFASDDGDDAQLMSGVFCSIVVR